MRCIIIDDDELSIALIRQYVEQTDGLELLSTFTNSVEGLNYLSKESVDLVFLDVEMPNLTGLEVARSLDAKQQVILITSNKDYAVEAFEHKVTDYMVKPVSYSRFLMAVTRAREVADSRPKEVQQTSLYVKDDNLYVNIPFAEIVWIEALGDYVTIHTTSKTHTVLTTMKAIEVKLPSKRFIRVHRSFIVPIEKISNLDGNMLIVDKKLIPIGKSYRNTLMDRLNIV